MGRSGLRRRLDALSFAAKVVLLGTLVGALVHAVIVPTHWGDARVTAILFIVDTIGFAIAFWWTFTSRRHWRLVSVAMLGGTALLLRLLHPQGLGDHGPGRSGHDDDRGGGGTRRPVAARGSPTAARQYAVALAALPVALVSLLGTNLIAGATTAAPVRRQLRPTPPRRRTPTTASSKSGSSSGDARDVDSVAHTAAALTADQLAGGQRSPGPTTCRP